MEDLVQGRFRQACCAVRARRRPISKDGRGMQIIFKKFYLKEKLGI
jgi:hypothetical protein